MKPLVSAQNLSYAIQGKTLVKDVSLSVSLGEVVTIIGPNGAGKSTLLKLLLGLLVPTKGSIEKSRALRVGYMPQRLKLNPQMPLTVDRFLALARHKPQSIDETLAKTGVQALRHTEMQSLSGGELQRVLLARALFSQPQLLVLDEPVQGVDVNGQSQLYQLITDLRDELNCGVLMVSHDLHLVMAGTDHVVCINQHVCCDGHPEKITNDPAYIELFGDHVGQFASDHVGQFATYSHHHNHRHNLHGDVVEDDCQH